MEIGHSSGWRLCKLSQAFWIVRLSHTLMLLNMALTLVDMSTDINVYQRHIRNLSVPRRFLCRTSSGRNCCCLCVRADIIHILIQVLPADLCSVYM